MDDIIIRPSVKMLRYGYALILVLMAASVSAYYLTDFYGSAPLGVALLPAVLLVWPLKRHIERHFTEMAIAGDKLRYSSGVFSRCRRLIPIARVQDVRVDQTPLQRLLRMGDISLETAGESSLLVIKGVDYPDHVAEDILRIAHAHAAGQREF